MNVAKVGRPPKNDTKDVMAIQAKIDAYFDGLGSGEEARPPTFSGLALALGYCSRQSLWENAKGGDAISLPLKTAMARIDEAYETRLHGNSPTGAIFALKNRGWTDKSEVDVNVNDLPQVLMKCTDEQ